MAERDEEQMTGQEGDKAHAAGLRKVRRPLPGDSQEAWTERAKGGRGDKAGEKPQDSWRSV